MLFIEILKSIVLGIVEGITEWLPVSSTGHMILVDEFVSLKVSSEFLELFLVVIQLGAIFAVPVFFFDKLNPFSRKKSDEQKHSTWRLWSKVVVGVLPAGVIGVLFDDFFDEHFYNYFVSLLRADFRNSRQIQMSRSRNGKIGKLVRCTANIGIARSSLVLQEWCIYLSSRSARLCF